MRAASCVAAGLSVSQTLDEDASLVRNATPAAAWDLAKAVGKSSAIPITSPVDFISGPEQRIRAMEALERQHRLLDADVTGGLAPAGSCWSLSRSPRIRRQATFASGTPIAFDTNGTVREARGLASIT